MSEKGKINAKPNKEFFIDMLTKDITLDKAIFDLIDNSIDAALASVGHVKDKFIKIELNEDMFYIHDNCGGIDKNVAINYAFNFGRPREYEKEKDITESIGRFGVGMKRAIFKIGNLFRIVTNDGVNAYKVEQNIKEWKDDSDNWSFSFEDIDETEINSGETKITITELFDNIKNDFQLNDFIDELRKEISIYFSMFIKDGLIIKINDIHIKEKDFELICEKGVIEPRSTEFEIEGVKCKIISGLAKTSEGKDDDPKEAGWYIFCNKRLVLLANKDVITGWGLNGISSFHNNYAMFRGFVFFESTNVDKLPLNTTKYGIDSGNPIYIHAKLKMSKHMKEQFQFLRKINNTNNLSVKKKIKQMSSIHLLKSYHYSKYSEKLIINNDVLFPKVSKDNTVKISFVVDKERFDAVKENLKLSSPEEVGLRIFDYYIKMNEL